MTSSALSKGEKYLKPTLQQHGSCKALAIDILVYLSQTFVNFLSVSDYWKILRRKTDHKIFYKGKKE